MTPLSNTAEDKQPFAAWLDEDPPRKRGRILLAATATALAFFWLPLASLLLLPEPSIYARPLSYYWSELEWALPAFALIASMVGVIAGRSVGRLHWLVGPSIVGIVACVSTLLAFTCMQHGVTIHGAPARYNPGPLHLQLALNAPRAIILGTVLLLAAVAGAVSQLIRRRLATNAVMNIGLACVGAGFLLMLLGRWAYTTYEGTDVKVFPEWSFSWLILQSPQVLPFFLGGIWLGWSLRSPASWAGGVVLGTLPVILGAAQITTSSELDVLPRMAPDWILMYAPLSAAIGVWTGTALSHARSFRALLWSGLALAGITLLHILIIYPRWRRWV